MVQAEAAVAAAGGPGTDIAEPTQTANDTTLAGTTSASLFTLDRSTSTVTLETTIGPGTVLMGEDTTCAAAIATLPSGTRPECTTDGKTQPFTVVAGESNLNTNTHVDYFVDEAVTQTETFLTAQTYEVVGAGEPPVVIAISPEDVPDGEVGHGLFAGADGERWDRAAQLRGDRRDAAAGAFALGSRARSRARQARPGISPSR